MAGRRTDTVRRRKGDRPGRRLPRTVYRPVAREIPAGKVENGIISGLDWFPTFVAAAGNPNIADELKKGKQLGDKTYKVHLDGYDQTNLITGKGPSNRHEIFYFAEGTLGAIRVNDYKYRFIDQPGGWLGGTVKVDWPILTNLRLDPFERTGLTGSLAFYNWFAYEFGDSSSCKKSSPRRLQVSWSSHRCRPARRSTCRQSRSRFKRRFWHTTDNRPPIGTNHCAVELLAKLDGALCSTP